MTEPRVPLSELGVLPAELNGLRKNLAPDWRGDPSLSLEDAAAFTQKRREATEAHEAAWREHQDANERWLAERTAAGRAAGNRAIEGIRPSPARTVAFRLAWGEAVLAWQRRHPRPEWDGKPTLPDGLLLTDDDLDGFHTATDDDRIWAEVH